VINLTTPQALWNYKFALISLFALVRGRAPERLTVSVLLAADLITFFLIKNRYWKPIEPTLVAIDSCVAIFFIGLALKSSRWWPLWAAAFHLLALAMVVFNALDPAVRPYAYYVGELIWDYLGLMALLFGTLFEARRAVLNPALFHASSNASAR
jgi:hypothetical protein